MHRPGPARVQRVGCRFSNDSTGMSTGFEATASSARHCSAGERTWSLAKRYDSKLQPANSIPDFIGWRSDKVSDKVTWDDTVFELHSQRVILYRQNVSNDTLATQPRWHRPNGTKRSKQQSESGKKSCGTTTHILWRRCVGGFGPTLYGLRGQKTRIPEFCCLGYKSQFFTL